MFMFCEILSGRWSGSEPWLDKNYTNQDKGKDAIETF